MQYTDLKQNNFTLVNKIINMVNCKNGTHFHTLHY